MKTKQLIILSLIFAALAIGVVIKGLQTPQELVTAEFTSLDFAFDKDKIAVVEIGKAGMAKPVRLEKHAGRWQLPQSWGARADEVKVGNLLNAIHGASGEMRGSGEKLFGDFGIGEQEAFIISLKNEKGEEEASFYVGHKKAGSGEFIRKTDSNKIFLTQARILAAIGIYSNAVAAQPQTDFWHALDFIRFDSAKVREINLRQFTADGEALNTAHVRKSRGITGDKEWTWVREKMPFKLDGEKVNAFLDRLTGLRATGLKDPAGHYDWDKPQWELRVVSETGEEMSWLVNTQVQPASDDAPAEESFYIKSSQEPVVFELSEYVLGQMDIDDSEFFDDNALSVDSDAVTKVIIRKGKKEIPVDMRADGNEPAKTYLTLLKTFGAERLLFAPKEANRAKSPGMYQIEIQAGENGTMILDVSDRLSEDTKEYPALIRGTGIPFAIDEFSYKKYFEGLEALVPASE